MSVKNLTALGIFGLLTLTAFAGNNMNNTQALCQEIVRVPVNFSILKALVYEGVNLDCQCEVKRKVYYIAKDKVRTTYYMPSTSTYQITAMSGQIFVETAYVSPMQIALTRRDYSLMRFLVSHGINLNETRTNGLLPLEYAYHSNDYSLINSLVLFGASIKKVDLGCPENLSTARYMINRGADPNTLKIDCALHDMTQVGKILALRPGSSQKPLDNYSYNELVDKPEILSILLQNGFPVSDVNNPYEKMTLLMLAAKKGKSSIIQILLDHKAAIDQKDELGYTALLYAVQSNSYNIIETLLQKGADPNIIASNGKDSPIFLAIAGNQTATLKLLLEYTADFSKGIVDMANDPLIMAFKQKKINIAELLIEYGEDPEKIVQYFGAQYLYRHPQELENALRLGVSPNIELKEGNIINLAIAEDNEEVAMIMLDYNANPNIVDTTGSTPLHNAITQNKYELAYQLIDGGTDINAVVPKYDSYLHRAIEADNLVMVHVLLKKGADPDLVNSNGETPMLVAVSGGKYEIAKKLAYYWAKPDCESFYKAVETENLDMVKLLVKRGADLNCKKNNHQSVISYARVKNKSYHIEQYLRAIMGAH